MAEGRHPQVVFEEEEDITCNQEYKLFKKAAPNLYDFLLLHSLEWPSTTFQWLPQTQSLPDALAHFALLSANQPDPEPSSLVLMRVLLPLETKSTSAHAVDAYSQHQAHKITLLKAIAHPFEVLRARHCPLNSELIAVTNSKGEVHLTTFEEAIIELVGHTSEGYGLAWSSVRPTFLASGHTDKLVCVWDVEGCPQENGKMLPLTTISYNSTPVEDVAWHRQHPQLLASCSDDRQFMLWDLRQGPPKRPLFAVIGHTDEVYSLDFNPFNEFLLATSSADETISVWDLRNLTRSFETLGKSRGGVVKVQWNPHVSSLLGSCTQGRQAHVWDIGDDSKDRMVFKHSLHRSKVVDFDWNPSLPLLAGSVEEGNCVHVWDAEKGFHDKEP